MSEIVERLRRFSLSRSGKLRPNPDAVMADEAAAEIERLQADLANTQQVYHDTQWQQLKEAKAEIERLQRYVSERNHYRRQWSEAQTEIVRRAVEIKALRKITDDASDEIERLTYALREAVSIALGTDNLTHETLERLRDLQQIADGRDPQEPPEKWTQQDIDEAKAEATELGAFLRREEPNMTEVAKLYCPTDSVDCHDAEFRAEIVRLRTELADTKADALRLHKEKMDMIDRAINLGLIQQLCPTAPKDPAT